MKKIVALLMAFVLCGSLMACGGEPVEVSCGHEDYSELIAALENKDYDAARELIDEMEGVEEMAPAAAATEPQTEATDAPAAQVVGQNVIADVELVTLDRHNLLDYFELREDYIFEDTVKCYQYFLLREEYEKRLIDIQDVAIEISGFDATAYGELDQADQLFFPSRYDMTTGELTFLDVYITRNGEGHIVLSEFDEKGSCFEGYLMDIAITEAAGTLVLEAE